MLKKPIMAKSKKSKAKVEEISTPIKPSLPKKSYRLEKDVVVGEELYKKGSLIRLTEEGRKYFKTQNYIK
jgi:CTP-dependent riboflavin kinase